ncbi:MAG TPA: hypothetical protein VHI31_07185 [Actinomycetota bacterium]|nr:hypothetical protein [Actinomycetota bacterium]
MRSLALLVRSHPWFTAFSAAYAGGLTVFGFGRFPVRAITYLAIVLLDFLVVAALNRRTRLPGWLLWGLSIWGLMHMIGGLVFWESSQNGIVYGIWLIPRVIRYDQLTHALGFAMGTAACWFGLDLRTVSDAPAAGKALMAGLMGMGLGALNEVVEFASIYAVPDQQVGGLENMGWDLIFNLMGCFLMGLWLWLVPQGRSTERDPERLTRSSDAEPEPLPRQRSSSSAL